MKTWVNTCSLNGLRVDVEFALDKEGRLPLSPPLLVIRTESLSLSVSLIVTPKQLRTLATFFITCAEHYGELDSNYDKDRAANDQKATD